MDDMSLIAGYISGVTFGTGSAENPNQAGKLQLFDQRVDASHVCAVLNVSSTFLSFLRSVTGVFVRRMSLNVNFRSYLQTIDNISHLYIQHRWNANETSVFCLRPGVGDWRNLDRLVYHRAEKKGIASHLLVAKCVSLFGRGCISNPDSLAGALRNWIMVLTPRPIMPAQQCISIQRRSNGEHDLLRLCPQHCGVHILTTLPLRSAPETSPAPSLKPVPETPKLPPNWWEQV